MALHLITGFAGYEHIKSSDQGAYNIATFGSGNFVFNRGSEFKATTTSNNTINIADGEAMLQGRFIKAETSEDVTIENGTQGKTRQDLICIRYEKSASDGVESAKLVVIKGAENGGDPAYNNGNITDGTDSVADFPLYRVKLNGITIESVTALFELKVSIKEYMDSYQIIPAEKDKLGGIKVGKGLKISKDGVLEPNLGSYLGFNGTDQIYVNMPSQLEIYETSESVDIEKVTIPAKGVKKITIEIPTEKYGKKYSFLNVQTLNLYYRPSGSSSAYGLSDCIYNVIGCSVGATTAFLDVQIYNAGDTAKEVNDGTVYYNLYRK